MLTMNSSIEEQRSVGPSLLQRVGVISLAAGLGVTTGCFDGLTVTDETETETATATDTQTEPEDPRCGDGIKEEWEPCDDGNDVDTDACTNSCTVAICGDFIIQDGVEECDDGNQDNSDQCTTQCTLATCGDGHTQLGNMEQCDDGNDVDTDDCTNMCGTIECGDGVLQHQSGEECDDHNTTEGDGCSGACFFEWKYAFVSSAMYTANLGGHDGADAKCASAAAAAELPGAYKAWISTGTVSAADHLELELKFLPYHNTLDQQIAANGDDLLDDELDFSLALDENGMPAPLWDGVFCQVWTGTQADGTTNDAQFLCEDWSVANSLTKGQTGACDSVTGWSEDGYEEPCDAQLPIYCFQQ